MRRTDIRRDSKPTSHELYADKEEKAFMEARNGLLQFDEVFRLVDESKVGFKLRLSTIQKLQKLAIKDIYTCGGNFRTRPVLIAGTTHVPPDASEISEHLERMCDYVNGNWERSSALHLAAFAMWNLNWIHPFSGGNGRTSRAISYLILCTKLGYRLPGINTIPEQIVLNRQPYYEALDAADLAWAEGRIDVSRMEELLTLMLAEQLFSVLDAASG